MKCRLCGSTNLIEKTYMWYGRITKRIKCLDCGLIH